MNVIEAAFNKPSGFERGANNGIQRNSQYNVRLALNLMKVDLSHNVFSGKLMFAVSGGAQRCLDDAAIDRLWLAIDAQYGFRPNKELFITIIADAARQNPFHPVCNYLDSLTWDGIKRIDSWLTEYGGAEANPYTCAVGALVLVAAVRRVRQPGAKFDEMLVLESPQGIGQKSSAIAALCPDPLWFSDDLPLDANSREVIERTSGHWLIEASELSGMARRDVEHLKSFMSRRVDTGRLAYARMPTEQPRHFILIGTTNAARYLRDSTGARRFWPVTIVSFDLLGIARDRDQLWAEAAARERAGASIRLPAELWPLALEQQEERQAEDPWFPLLMERFGDANGKIRVAEVWTLLGVDAGRQTQEQFNRLGTVMRGLGFERKKARQGSAPVYHYVRGTAEERELPLNISAEVI